MKVKVFVALVMYISTCITTFAHALNSCQIIYDNMLMDTKLKGLYQRLNSWKQYENQCSKDGTYQLYRGYLYFSYGYLKDAADFLEESIPTADYDTKKHKKMLCALYYDLGEIDKLKNTAYNMISLYPNWYGSYFCLGDYYLKIKDFLAAKYYYLKAIEIDDSDPGVFVMLSMAVFELGNYHEVIDYYLQAFKLNPRKPLLSRRGSELVVIAFIKIGELQGAKDILDLQQEFDKDVHRYSGFQRVTQYYEEELAKLKS